MKKFKINTIYNMTWITDADRLTPFSVIARTAATLTIETIRIKKNCMRGEITRHRIKNWNGVEYVLPFGNYSMRPELSADKEVIKNASN
jgi:hypothetical protein